MRGAAVSRAQLPRGMEYLGRYPLSTILSYLSETDGTSFLITKKRYAYQLLPIFVKESSFDGLNVRGSKTRHKFVVSPVQDPTVLLERLNTRRLCRRRERKEHGFSTKDLAAKEWQRQSTSRPPELDLLRFLDRSSLFRDRGSTLLVSYPRSGNSLVRSLLERATGFVSGSDTRPDRNLSRELAEQHGMVGEGVIQSNLVAFVKTHWPERTGTQIFAGRRAILLVRNPFDAIDSYWNMNATLSHTKTVTSEVYERFRDKFEALVKNEILVWLRFHKYWLTDATCPILVVRYEDLLLDTEKELSMMLAFSLGVDTLPAYWSERVARASRQSVHRLGSYKPRTQTKRHAWGKSLRKGHFSEDLLRDMHNRAETFGTENFLRLFGYDMYVDGFPDHLGTSSLERKPGVDRPLFVNDGIPIRPVSCPYGRAMQTWRHSVTNNDQAPLPTEP